MGSQVISLVDPQAEGAEEALPKNVTMEDAKYIWDFVQLLVQKELVFQADDEKLSTVSSPAAKPPAPVTNPAGPCDTSLHGPSRHTIHPLSLEPSTSPRNCRCFSTATSGR